MKQYFLWLAKLITMLVVVVLFFTFCLGAIIAASTGAIETAQNNSKNKVAVIELNGVIEDSRKVLEKLHKHVADKDIKGIVLKVNSPGGAVAPSQAIYTAVQKLKEKKPVVVAMGSLAASGGLYVALGASKVFCQPGTLTGSIGVIMQIPNFSEITNKVGFKMVTIKSGKLKDAGNSFEPMKPEAREYLTKTAELAHKDFIQAVADGRKLDIAEVRKFADGRIILGSKAMELGLVDGYGDVYDAGREIFEILGKPLPEGEYPNLVYTEDKFGDLKKLLEPLGRTASRLTGQMQLLYMMQ
jgi:protease-4